MWAALRSRYLHLSATSLPSSSLTDRSWKLGFSGLNRTFSSSSAESSGKELLSLQEVEKVLSDVRADDVTVIPVGNQCDWADFMVIATGRSTWHIKNIAQALIYKARFFVLFFFFSSTIFFYSPVSSINLENYSLSY